MIESKMEDDLQLAPPESIASEQTSLFQAGQSGILYFSRGRGRGHAIPDMEIGRHLSNIATGIDIVYASYSSGLEAFHACGYDAIDLQMQEDPDPWDALVKQLRLVSYAKP